MKTVITASGPRLHVRNLCRGLVLAAGLLLAQGTSALAEDYRLDVLDKLRIRVVEWQTTEGAVRDWSAISGDYAVGAAGQISLPLVGELPVSGKTTAEVAQEIGLRMQKLFALRDLPTASVELAQYRPIFVAGEVQTPGEYPFAPNMTVLKAVSLGGGLRRADPGQRFARDFIRADGDASVLVAERNRLLARRARLQAEIAEQDSITMPKELDQAPEAAILLDSETELMKSRDRRQKVQLKALADLKTLLQTEIASLDKKSETQTRQLSLVEDDLKKVDSLAERGLTISSRKLTLEQRTADLQAALLDIDTATLKAKQDATKAAQDETNLINDWDATLAQEMQNTESELEAVTLKLETSRKLMSEALLQSADAGATNRDPSGADATYVILREKDGRPTEIPATETTQILPGDVIKVGYNVAMR
ncbi:polysaccharide export protein [Rhizobium sp. TRM96647]|uniref:polysaccharide biosynthesis/export family protein n=1 Tax=unclassified Rhizobium TaxID=2613769 RepID=UPI0021E9342C|nr:MULTISPECIES: polysaccharide biosynthesis/export family protein [unclassified Rhizobium]MCV3737250.1 polysaccharide export protein [Rhizobium sp. TRM96647]MCV3759234.1 polysaccharide export protein [Rhizobium sp. TRM96650]